MAQKSHFVVLFINNDNRMHKDYIIVLIVQYLMKDEI
jgi:hypothetical protein